uniref:Uncharacterized protein n=1 Tax=Anguilla anguilla TaxID=7936 RepID=A0A0E9SSS6_ANGAN
MVSKNIENDVCAKVACTLILAR